MFGWVTGGSRWRSRRAYVTTFYVELSVGRRIAAAVVGALRGARQSKAASNDCPTWATTRSGRSDGPSTILLANLTSLEVRMIEQGQELRSTREELILKHALGCQDCRARAAPSERALLFDIVRASASERELDTVLGGRRDPPRLRAPTFASAFCSWPTTTLERLTLRAVYRMRNGRASSLGRIVLFEEGVLGDGVATSSETPTSRMTSEALEERAASGNRSPTRAPSRSFRCCTTGRTTGADRGDAERPPLRFRRSKPGCSRRSGDQLGLAIRHTQLFDELRRGSQQDDLTGLETVAFYAFGSKTSCFAPIDSATRVSVLAIDIDHFKALNDRHGHPTGDACAAQARRA